MREKYVHDLDGYNRQITVFAVRTIDPNIKFIEAGEVSERQRKNIGLNEWLSVKKQENMI